ncbi:hypothetical protein UlMin_043564 [Ulmus minor]
MFSSQGFLTKKGPFGAIRVAAYFFKKLKKAQVLETDISSSVDKILLDEMLVVTYRVLGYLLLGVVRVYSKKVEYLLDDSQEVLIRMKDFVVSTKEKLPADTQRAAYLSITLPKRFELDAFDLEILDDDDTTEGNVVPRETITIKDSASDNAGFRHYSLDMSHLEEIAGSHHTSFDNYTQVVENILSSYQMGIRVSTLHNLDSLKATIEKHEENRFSQEECMDLEMFYGSEVENQNAVELHNEDHQDNLVEINDPKILSRKDGIPAEASTERLEDWRLSGENDVNCVRSCGIEGEPSDHMQSCGEDLQIDLEHIIASESELPQNETCQVIGDDHILSNLQIEMEKLRGEGTGFATSSGPEELQDHGAQFVEEHCGDRDENFAEIFENGEESPFVVEENPKSMKLDGTPELKIPDASGAPSPDFKVIKTPASKEHARVFRKRKCAIDDMIVLPNEVIRQSLKDSSDLVCKRKKVAHSALAVWRASLPRILRCGFLEHLVPCVSSELRSLYREEKLKIKKSAPEEMNMSEIPTFSEKEQIGVALESLHASEIPTVADTGQIGVALEPMDVYETPTVGETEQIGGVALDPVDVSEVPTVAETEQIGVALEALNVSEVPTVVQTEQIGVALEALDVSESPTGQPEQRGIAPETPVQRSALVKSCDRPSSPETPNYDRERPEPFDFVEKEPSLIRDEEHELNLMDEVPNSFSRENNESDGLSERTRMVAQHLQSRFESQKKLGKEKVVNLLQVAKGKTKKENARLFYEMLVLSSKGCVDAKQEDAYGDIQVKKLPKLDKI